jgi:hypothetical protein
MDSTAYTYTCRSCDANGHSAEYQRQLEAAIDAAVAHLDRADASALFLRIRPDVGWCGEFHIQSDLPPDTTEL